MSILHCMTSIFVFCCQIGEADPMRACPGSRIAHCYLKEDGSQSSFHSYIRVLVPQFLLDFSNSYN